MSNVLFTLFGHELVSLRRLYNPISLFGGLDRYASGSRIRRDAVLWFAGHDGVVLASTSETENGA
jgi:hypothetical protein